jgi:hypothetical protein
MLGFLKERPGVFGPDEVHTLVAASIRHGRPLKPAGSSTRRLKPKLRGRSSQNTLVPRLWTVSATTPDCMMALCWLWLNQI